MNLPSFTADASLYRSATSYGVFPSLPALTPASIAASGVGLASALYQVGIHGELTFGSRQPPRDLVPVGYACNTVQLSACNNEAQLNFERCRIACDSVCAPAERYPSLYATGWCKTCRDAAGDCGYLLQAALDDCRRWAGCPAGYVCMQDLQRPQVERCCTLDAVLCGGICRSSECPPGKALSPLTCSCECPPIACRAPFIVDSAACTCKCPTQCPIGFLQDPVDCGCSCPPGTANCREKCVVLGVDRFNCGSCGVVCGPDEDCCFGECVWLNRDPNCGGCAVDCRRKQQTCCAPGGQSRGYCADLGTRRNCGACGHACRTGEDCCSGI